MELRFRLGAVLELELVTGERKSGKVIQVYHDEVVLKEQLCYEEDNCNSKNPKALDGDAIHIRRSLIGCWSYANIDQVTKKKEYWRITAPKEYTEYDTVGYCYGDGEDCSNIHEV